MTRFGSLAASIVAQAEARAAEQQSPSRAVPRAYLTALAVRGENDGHQFQQRKERV